MSDKLFTFPIITTDKTASESNEGLCPYLRSSVSLSGCVSGVNSEFGIRYSINDYFKNLLSGSSIGDGDAIFKDYIFDDEVNRPSIKLRTIKTNNANRFSINETSGKLNIAYDGAATTSYQVSGLYVQGGAYQVGTQMGGYVDFPYTSLVGTNLYTVSGLSSTSVTLSANAYPTNTSSNALYNWNTDIAVGKIMIRIPIENSFPYANQIMWVGKDSYPQYYGYFKTRTASQILTGGEWTEFHYSSNMYNNQYDYLTSPTHIKLYTTGVIVNGYAPGGYLSGNIGAVDVRVFYDKPQYGGVTNESISLNAAVNNQSTPITKTFATRGVAYIKYVDGNYDTTYEEDSTTFNVSVSGTEYYGNKENWIEISGNATTALNIYIRSASTNTNVGTMNLMYNFK